MTDAPAAPEVAPGPAAPEPPAKPAGRTVRIFGRTYPFVAPNIRDPRLHLAAVIISIHVLGQIALGFRVSVPQILVAILVCAVIEVGWTLHKTGTLVWPASAMLTGSGVALILRLSDMQSDDHWTWRGWYVFALVAGLSLLTKYVIRYRGSHIFNPSNVGLVAAFLLLGSTRIEPLDFWWAPFDGWMVAAYLIILVGGLLITARLHLLGMSAAFWLTLAVGIGVLAASGHCMTARWSFEPVCGAHFWWVIVFSPEILIFLFFMITDPKTTPAGRVARVAFGIGVAMVCTLLIAPQTTEFGAKVALLSGLVVLCVARLFFERFLPAAGSERDRLGAFVARPGRRGDGYLTPGRALARGAIVGAAVVLLGDRGRRGGGAGAGGVRRGERLGGDRPEPPSRSSTSTSIPPRSHGSPSTPTSPIAATCRRPTRRRSRSRSPRTWRSRRRRSDAARRASLPRSTTASA